MSLSGLVNLSQFSQGIANGYCGVKIEQQDALISVCVMHGYFDFAGPATNNVSRNLNDHFISRAGDAWAASPAMGRSAAPLCKAEPPSVPLVDISEGVLRDVQKDFAFGATHGRGGIC